MKNTTQRASRNFQQLSNCGEHTLDRKGVQVIVYITCLLCSSTYMLNIIARYLAGFRTISYSLNNTNFNETSATQPTSSNVLSDHILLHSVPSNILQSIFLLRWMLILISSLLVWCTILLVLRWYNIHGPIYHLCAQIISALIKVQSGVRFLFHPSRLWGQEMQNEWERAQHEIDIFDLLIVSSLLPKRRSSCAKITSADSNKLLNFHGPKPRFNLLEYQKKARLVINPREGARGGRHHSSQIILDDPFVSRCHFEIQYEPMEKEYFLRDLGSVTGTFLYIRPSIPKILQVDDRVKVGDTEMKIIAIQEDLCTNKPLLRIEFVEGPMIGIRQTIGSTPVTLGRKSSNALSIPEDASISGRHCVFSHLGDGFYITDLNSTNGTAFRLSPPGKRSKRYYLIHGDTFGIGANRFLAEYSLMLKAKRQHRTTSLDNDRQ
uniref:Uncharacterized protein AlNc14C135G7056 n=1 Tax=Albugo laibachii Nc14 TaxID=890382 RepID=F0W6G2_9STRA|nr:conserved hypothetical protein [Albugo laibachii Nc14]CCA21813.1 conserved hypothetical protein [Albugo laibachii Nc14]|eukprot:CCA21813.1 conserved hypothetical protein [Albugo laibachii Nc14]